MWNATQHNLDHVSNHGVNIKIRVIQSNSLSFDIKTIILWASRQTIMSFKMLMLQNIIPTKSQSFMLPFLNTRYPSCLSRCQPSNCFILQYSQTFSTLTQYLWLQSFNRTLRKIGAYCVASQCIHLQVMSKIIAHANLHPIGYIYIMIFQTRGACQRIK